MENRETETFKYTYSAKEQEEIKAIRKKYSIEEPEADKMEQIRRLDAAVTQKATTISLVFGIVGALIMGTGMSLVMTEIGLMVGLNETLAMLIGIPVGLLGIILVCVAYPIYIRIIKKERKKIAPEILRLTEELMR